MPLSSERAEEIRQNVWHRNNLSFSKGPDPFPPTTPEEDREICDYWRTIDGQNSYYDAVCKMARGEHLTRTEEEARQLRVEFDFQGERLFALRNMSELHAAADVVARSLSRRLGTPVTLLRGAERSDTWEDFHAQWFKDDAFQEATVRVYKSR